MTQVKPLTLNIDKDLWHQFKSAVTRERTLNAALVELIQDYVERKRLENEVKH